MKNRKCNLYITGGIAIIGIIGLVILQLRCYELIGIHGGTRFLSDFRQLGIAMMGGLFTSAFVTFLISIGNIKMSGRKRWKMYILRRKIWNANFRK